MKLLLFVALGLITTLADDRQLLKDFTDGNAKFTANVYKELLKFNSGNFLVCPLSVEIVLALVHAGAKGSTAKQLTDGLQLPETTELVQQTIFALTPRLQEYGGYSLSSANKVYVKDGFQISDTYKSIAVNVFKSDIENINFSQKEKAAETMNSWVEKQTLNKIHDLIDKNDLDGDTRLVLVNAIYFHSNWIYSFQNDATRKQDFYLNNNDKVEIDMMTQVEAFLYYECEKLNAKFLKMFYIGRDISLTIVLPNDKEGLGALEANIDNIFAKRVYIRQIVHVVLPKFKIETSIEFKPILQSLGIVDAFEDNADLSGIGANQGDLKINKVIQKALFKVYEYGTTATPVEKIGGGGAAGHYEMKTFKADHPFLFFLRIKNINVFAGRYIKP